jgi:hypothetical protein
LFTTDQMELLRRQQELNLQLLLQAYTMEYEMSRGEQSPFLCHLQRQIDELIANRDRARALNNQVDEKDNDASTTEQPIAFPSFHDIVGLDVAKEWITSMSSICQRDEKFACRMQRPVRRRRRVRVNTDQEQTTQKDQYCWEVEDVPPLELPSSLKMLNQTFKDIFDDQLIPRIVCVNVRTRTSFLSAQDALLRIGLDAFGDDWDTIQAHLLPNMTAKQIMTRYNNLKSRRYKRSPIKDWHLMRVKPLTVMEEERLRKVSMDL